MHAAGANNWNYFARRKVLPILPPLIDENFVHKFFPPVLKIAYTALGKFLDNYYNTNVVGLGENFIPPNFLATYTVIITLGRAHGT